MPTAQEMLTGTQLVNAVLNRLSQQFASSDSVKLNPAINIVIDDDSDWHRTRKGYFTYSAVMPITIGTRSWLVSQSEKTGSYPGDFLKGDLAFILLDHSVEKGIARFREVRGLAHSLFVVHEEGLLIPVPTEPFSQEFFHRYSKDFADLAAEQPVLDGEFISLSTLGPVVKQSARYLPDAVETLAQKVSEYLS